jgi:hypothetical protein
MTQFTGKGDFESRELDRPMVYYLGIILEALDIIGHDGNDVISDGFYHTWVINGGVVILKRKNSDPELFFSFEIGSST